MLTSQTSVLPQLAELIPGFIYTCKYVTILPMLDYHRANRRILILKRSIIRSLGIFGLCAYRYYKFFDNCISLPLQNSEINQWFKENTSLLNKIKRSRMFPYTKIGNLFRSKEDDILNFQTISSGAKISIRLVRDPLRIFSANSLLI